MLTIYTKQIGPPYIRSSNPAVPKIQNCVYLQVSPGTVAYHVQVNYAEEEEVIEKTTQCDLLEGDEISEGTELEELTVIFKLVQARQKMPPQIMRWPEEYFLSNLLGEV